MSQPFTLSGIDHVLLLVDGMAGSVAFYCDVIGCRVRERLPDYGMVELEAGAASIALVDVGAAEGAWARPEVSGGRNLDHLSAWRSGPMTRRRCGRIWPGMASRSSRRRCMTARAARASRSMCGTLPAT